jgi:hypothetical protein
MRNMQSNRIIIVRDHNHDYGCIIIRGVGYSPPNWIILCFLLNSSQMEKQRQDQRFCLPQHCQSFISSSSHHIMDVWNEDISMLINGMASCKTNA